MRATKCPRVLLAAVLLAGCASAPEHAANGPDATEPARSAARAVAAAAITPSAVIDLNKMRDDSASTVICRDRLKQGSNVIVTTCMTRADWETFKRRQAMEAQEILRMLQGGAYR